MTSSPEHTRMSLAVRPNARAALERRLKASPGYSATDLINKAVLLLDQVEEALARGDQVVILAPSGMKTRLIIL